MIPESLKQLFYGEISIGKRKQCKPKMRFKDRLKNNHKLSKMSVHNWKIDAVDRSQWRNMVFKGLATFELFRTSKASFKRAIRKEEDVVPNEHNVLEPHVKHVVDFAYHLPVLKVTKKSTLRVLQLYTTLLMIKYVQFAVRYVYQQLV